MKIYIYISKNRFTFTQQERIHSASITIYIEAPLLYLTSSTCINIYLNQR